ncbi:MAG: sulfite exporter TauE/SafE family protein [Acidobacteriota bacterium]
MFEYFFLFPVGLLVATVAMSSGVAGSNFWIPIYLLGLGLDPRLAFWTSLVTMLFGSGSGVVRNLRDRTVEVGLVRSHAPWVLASAAVGGLAAPRIDVEPLLAGYALFVGVYGGWLLVSSWRTAGVAGGSGDETGGGPLRLRATVAGGFQGLIATGSGALLMPAFLSRRPQAPARAVGSAVLLVFMSSLVAALVRLDGALLETLRAEAGVVFSMTAFAAAGAALGGQLGPRVAARLPALWLRRYVAGVLITVGVLVARRVVLGMD